MVLVYQILSKKSVISTEFINLKYKFRSQLVPSLFKKFCQGLTNPYKH